MHKFVGQHRHQLIYCLPALTVLLLAASFLWYAVSWLVLIALVPFIAFCDYYLRESRSRHPHITTNRFIGATWLMGFMFLMLATSWFIATDTRSWSGLGAFPLQLTVFILWILLGGCLSLGFLVLGWAVSRFGRHWSPKMMLGLLLPILWLLCEYGRSWLLSFVVYGRGGSLGPYWNFGTLGFAAAATPLVYSARFVGLFGLSGLVVVLNTGLYWLIRRHFGLATISLVIIAAVTGLGISLYRQPATHPVRVTTVELPSEANGYFDQLEAVARAQPALKTRPADLLALPEYSYYFDYIKPVQAAAIKQSVFHNGDGLITYSRKDYVPGVPPYNQIVTKDSAGHLVSAQHKSFLIPTGEYLPAFASSTFHLIGLNKINVNFTGTITVSKASKLEVPVLYRQVKYGVLACSGVIAPQLYQRLSDLGADVLVNDASLNEFHYAAAYHQQARQFARFIAVANDRPLVQAARGGYSYILDRDGHFLYRSPQNGVHVGVADVKEGGSRTAYSYVGEWTILAGVVCLAIVWLTSFRIKE